VEPFGRQGAGEGVERGFGAPRSINRQAPRPKPPQKIRYMPLLYSFFMDQHSRSALPFLQTARFTQEPEVKWSFGGAFLIGPRKNLAQFSRDRTATGASCRQIKGRFRSPGDFRVAKPPGRVARSVKDRRVSSYPNLVRGLPTKPRGLSGE